MKKYKEEKRNRNEQKKYEIIKQIDEVNMKAVTGR